MQLRVLAHRRLLAGLTQHSGGVSCLSVFADRYSASSALAELRHRVSTSASTTGSSATGPPVPSMQGADRQTNEDSESQRILTSAVTTNANRASQPNRALNTSFAGIGTHSHQHKQQLLGGGRPDNAKPNVTKGFLDLSDVETVISRLEHQLGRPSTSPQLRHK